MHNLRIVFFGTPEFAVSSLEIIHKEGFQVVGVVTAPDKPSGRGLKLVPSPVKIYAENAGLPILQPEKLKAPSFFEELKALHADLFIVVAFRMLPESIWSMPKFGTFNLHASLLPDYRGAAPINWAIIQGEKETGVTTFFLQHEIDTGNIILQDKEPIQPTDTVGDLYERLMHKGAKLVLKTVQRIANGDLSSSPQLLPSEPKHAPKIFKETCEVNWSQPAENIYNFIRGLSPFPSAFSYINQKYFKLYKAEVVSDEVTDGLPGKLHSDNKSFLHVGTSAGSLSILELQAEGKKRMTIHEYLMGNSIV
ncbi:MAG: methionyl-tRNA formyltransferase [Cytophagales bacterium]|nr:methionyl-tRNA formyltransferase [Cytophagales bacterium]